MTWLGNFCDTPNASYILDTERFRFEPPCYILYVKIRSMGRDKWRMLAEGYQPDVKRATLRRFAARFEAALIAGDVSLEDSSIREWLENYEERKL